MPHRAATLRRLPSVDRLLHTPAAQAALSQYARPYVVAAIRAVLDRHRARAGGLPSADADGIEHALMAEVSARLAAQHHLRLRRVINATGVILHTNLGRALLPPAAIDAVAMAAAHPTNLEFDLAGGERGDRDDLVEAGLCALTGADAATVVNNNAAAVLLALNTVAVRREVVVSRGELIEIGGAFRIPDVMAKSGAVLREVGTTNRTHPRDYREAISERTALLLKVHTSNYRIVGFTRSVDLPALVAIGRETNIAVMEDLGSGALIDLSGYGIAREPIVAERIAAGADLVTFSGDKLLGGPQAGIIVGRGDLIRDMRRNPLKRALRCDKLTLAALAATLQLYRSAPDLAAVLPTLQWLTRPLAELERIGAQAQQRLRATLGDGYDVRVVESTSEVGSGALPTAALPSRAISITHPHHGADELARRFRSADPPIIGRIHDGQLLLDLRGVNDPDELVPRMDAAP